MLVSSDIEEYVPCYNFSMVCPGIYRSAHPTRKNFRFLRALRLKSVCYLCPEEYPSDNVEFCKLNDITIFHFNLEENREPFSEVRRDIVDAVMRVVMDTRNHPILIHCERGRHRTGVICGCVRKLQGWSLGSVYSDYTLHNNGKGRLSDQQFLDLYQPIVKVELPYVPAWLLEEFTTGSNGSSLLKAQEVIGMRESEGGAGWDQHSPVGCNPQVVWSTTEGLMGSRGGGCGGDLIAHSAPPDIGDGAPDTDDVGSKVPQRALQCVSSTRSNVTLILCANQRGLQAVQPSTEPMVVAVKPQYTYVLGEYAAEKGLPDRKDKKEKADKKEKKDKGEDKEKGDKKEKKEKGAKASSDMGAVET